MDACDVFVTEPPSRTAPVRAQSSARGCIRRSGAIDDVAVLNTGPSKVRGLAITSEEAAGGL